MILTMVPGKVLFLRGVGRTTYKRREMLVCIDLGSSSALGVLNSPLGL